MVPRPGECSFMYMYACKYVYIDILCTCMREKLEGGKKRKAEQWFRDQVMYVYVCKYYFICTYLPGACTYSPGVSWNCMGHIHTHTHIYIYIYMLTSYAYGFPSQSIHLFTHKHIYAYTFTYMQVLSGAVGDDNPNFIPIRKNSKLIWLHKCIHVAVGNQWTLQISRHVFKRKNSLYPSDVNVDKNSLYPSGILLQTFAMQQLRLSLTVFHA